MVRRQVAGAVFFVMASEAMLLGLVGCFGKSQKLRYSMERVWSSMSKKELREWAQEITSSDIRLGEIAQQEDCLSIELWQLRKKKESKMGEQDAEDKKQEEMLAQRVKDLRQEFIRQSIQHAAIEARIPYGAIEWGYRQHRTRFNWHMKAELLVEICVKLGGCCARKCRCCSKRRGVTVTHRGHCTVNCKCCRDARGFDWEQEEDLKLFHPDLKQNPNDTRTRNWLSGHIWGDRLFA